MIPLLVENAISRHSALINNGLIEKYKVAIAELQERPWKMIDFTLVDPSGVLWQVGHNC